MNKYLKEIKTFVAAFYQHKEVENIKLPKKEIQKEQSDIDILKESFNESVSKYKAIIDENFIKKEKKIKDEYDSKKDELISLEEDVKKLKKFAEEINLREKIYKIYNYIKYPNNGITDSATDSQIEIGSVSAEGKNNGVYFNFNDKLFTLLAKSYDGVYPDGEVYGGEILSLYDSDKKLILKFLVSRDYNKEWFEDDKMIMERIDVFKNSDWVLDISLVYENIINQEKIHNLPKKYDTSDIEKIKNNFNL